MDKIKSKTIVPDTSILINKHLSGLIEEGKLKKMRVLVPRAVIDELQAQASRGREIGFEAEEEKNCTQKFCSKGEKQKKFEKFPCTSYVFFI